MTVFQGRAEEYNDLAPPTEHALAAALWVTQPARVQPVGEKTELVLMAPAAPNEPVAMAAEESPSRMLDLDFSVLTEPAPPHKKK